MLSRSTAAFVLSLVLADLGHKQIHAQSCTITVCNSSYRDLNLQTYDGADIVWWIPYSTHDVTSVQYKMDTGRDRSDGCLVEYRTTSVGCPSLSVLCAYALFYQYYVNRMYVCSGPNDNSNHGRMRRLRGQSLEVPDNWIKL